MVNGGVYALLAIGFSLIFGVARIVNIAHTAFYMLAAYCFYTLLTRTGLGFLLSGLISVGAVTLLSMLCYRLVIEPVREHESAVLIATIALALVFQELMLFTFGGNFLGIPSTLEGAVRVLGVSIPYQRLLILVVAAAMLLLVWFVLYRTRFGLAIRATANDLEVASLMGMNVNRVAMATVALSVALASVAGVVVAPVFVVDPFMWLAPLVTMLAIVVLGGLGSLKGSLIGALVIGYVEAITVFAVPAGAYLKGAVALLIMVIVLLVRPEGLFGVVFEEER
ncbi:MAG TPA: branched-chain amino acid ABC transporter permease [Burkholderiales bacterium]